MKTAIGVIGPIRAGKDFAGQYISQNLKISLFEISAALKTICAEKGMEPSRENLIKLGTELAEEHGDGVLAKYIVDKAPENFVITGMRQLGQIEYLREHTNFTLIAINADPKIRFERAQKDRKLGEADSLEEFIERERRENSAPNKQRLFECIKMADVEIINEGSIEDFYLRLDSIIDSLTIQTRLS